MGKDEWYTPPEIFEALGTEFDLDPCHPATEIFVPARTKYHERGLEREWYGSVWMNPPFGGRNGYFPWIKKFIDHGNGIGLITALTSSEGFHKYIPQMDAICFPKGKTRFYESLNKRGGCPTTGIVLFALGKNSCEVLEKSELGIYFKINHHKGDKNGRNKNYKTSRKLFNNTSKY